MKRLFMLLRILFALLTCISVSSGSATAQSLQLFQVDTATNWVSGSYYFNTVTLSGSSIDHSFITRQRYSPSLFAFGDVKIKTYNVNGNVTEEESSTTDSLFITKTILLQNGGKIILGQAFHHLALYDLDTSFSINAGNGSNSFILQLDNAHHVVSFNEFTLVEDIVLDEVTHNLYFAEQFDYDSARLYVQDLSTGVMNQLALLSNARTIPRILKTQDYIYLCGSSISFSVNINSHHETTSFPYATFVIQLDQAGGFRWINIVEDITTPRMGIALAPDQGVYMSADLAIPVRIGADSLLGPTWGSDFFLGRIDSTGNYLWATEIPNNTLCGFRVGNGYYIDNDSTGNVYIAGSSRALLQWDSTTVIGRDTNISVPAALIYDKNGKISNHIIAEAGDDGFFSSIDVEKNGDFVISGRIQNTQTFDGVTKVVSSGYHPYFLYYKNIPAGIKNSGPGYVGVHYYPNPVRGTGELIIEKQTSGNSSLELFNLLGQKVLVECLHSTINQIQLPDLNSGIYIIRVDNHITGKLMIQ